jgi:hypothetical protein
MIILSNVVKEILCDGRQILGCLRVAHRGDSRQEVEQGKVHMSLIRPPSHVNSSVVTHSPSFGFPPLSCTASFKRWWAMA